MGEAKFSKQLVSCLKIGCGWCEGYSDVEVCFLAAILVIRKRRCFEEVCSSKAELVSSTKFLVASWVSVLPQFKGFLVDSILRSWKEVASSSASRMIPLPALPPPPSGCFKLNFGGSVWAGNLHPSGIGGLVRDSSGACIVRF